MMKPWLVWILSVGFFLSLGSARAEQAPVAPNCTGAGTEDSALFGGKSARQFFAERAANADCVSRYQQARQAYIGAREELKRLVDTHASGDQIDAQDDQLTQLRAPYLSALTECGPCAANTIQPPVEVPTASKTQYWYKSDASCQLPVTDATQLGAAFDRLTDILTHTKQYPRQSDGSGFDQILGVSILNNGTGQAIADADRIAPDPTYLYLSLFGPTIGVPTAFSYYFKDTYQITQTGSARSFSQVFNTVTPPRGFRAPSSLTFTTRGGASKVAYNQQLTDLTGSWYVNSDGYMRYCTAADFKIRTSFIESIGRDLLLNTISQAAENSLAANAQVSQ